MFLGVLEHLVIEVVNVRACHREDCNMDFLVKSQFSDLLDQGIGLKDARLVADLYGRMVPFVGRPHRDDRKRNNQCRNYQNVENER